MYGHNSTARARKTRFNRPPNGFSNQTLGFSQSDLEKEKLFLFGPWADRVRRSEFEPTHADLQNYITAYILRGGKITRLENSAPEIIQKTGTKYGSVGLDSGSSILC